MSQVQIPNSDHCTTGRLVPIDCKSSFLQVSTEINETSETDDGGLTLEELTEILISHEEHIAEMMSSLCPGAGAEIRTEEDGKKTQAAVISALQELMTANEGKRQKSARVLANTLEAFLAIARKVAANMMDNVSQQAIMLVAKDVIAQSGDIIIDAATESPTINILDSIKESLEKFAALCRCSSGQSQDPSPPGLEESDNEDEDTVLSDEGYSEFEVVDPSEWHTWYKNQYFVPERVS